MPQLNLAEVLESMLSAASTSFGDKWPKIKDIGTTSFKKLAQVFVDIEMMRAKGTITDEQAVLLLDMEKNTFKIVLLSVEILGIIAVENALNSALNVIINSVNKDIVITLIGLVRDVYATYVIYPWFGTMVTIISRLL